MSLEGIEKNFDRIKELGRQYSELLKEKKELEKKIGSMKNGYSEGKYERGVFSDSNKRLMEIKESIVKIREKAGIFSGNIRKEADEEIQNAK